jgi:hypothetical protein
MVKDSKYLKKFEEKWIARQKLSHEDALKILDSMWEEGISLGVFPPKNPMEGFEVDWQIARILNSCSKSC